MKVTKLEDNDIEMRSNTSGIVIDGELDVILI